MLPLSNKIFHTQLHIIWAKQYFYGKTPWGNEIIEIAEPAIKRYGYESAMISLIAMRKDYCITKEQFDIEYGIKHDDEKNNVMNEKERDDLSVGEDLETFIRRIKNGEIEKETCPEGEMKKTHSLCLLDKDQRRKLDRKDQDFLRTFEWGHISILPDRIGLADVTVEEWKKTEYKHLKFSKSSAWRRTIFVQAEIETD